MATVTVSVPYHGCPDTVRRAVDAVLGQTHAELVCVVVNDGDINSPPWPALADVDDPRLVRLDLPERRGRYFADAVVLAACGTEWFAPHDADDAATPEWLADMLTAADGHDVVLTAQRVHPLRGQPAVEPVRPWSDGRFRHHAHMAGLWRASWLRSVGGPRPDYRVGWDTMLTGAALALGAAAVVEESLYDRHRRRGSLTTAPATGTNSASRKAVMGRLRKLWPGMVEASASGPEAVAAVLTEGVDAELVAKVEQHAERLRRLLSGSEPAAMAPPAGAAGDESLWQGWALDQAGAQALAAQLTARAPRMIVEAGSGSSTVLLAEYARDTGATVVTLEHQRKYRDATAALLAARGLTGHVDLRLARLRRSDVGPWYDTDLPDGIDLALVDGPPEGDGGRGAALTALTPHLAEDAVLLVDDAGRPGERAALAAWERAGARVEPLATGGKPMALVHPRATGNVDACDVVLTLLTGDRPELLADTLAALRATAPGLLETAHVIALDNGADPDSAAVLAEHGDVIDLVEHRADRAAIGDATSHLAKLAADSGRPYWLHLEDDWKAAPGHPGWLDDARRILAEHDEVFQVRLRHSEERVLPYHIHTKRRLVWRDRGTWRYAQEAHYTTNPTLVRTEHAAALWPASGEREAQARAHAAGLRGVAQLVPGVFVHTGGGSRRAVTKCRA